MSYFWTWLLRPEASRVLATTTRASSTQRSPLRLCSYKIGQTRISGSAPGATLVGCPPVSSGTRRRGTLLLHSASNPGASADAPNLYGRRPRENPDLEDARP